MNPNPPEPPFLGNLGMMLTYKCSIACPHCIVEAGPHRREEMALDHALEWIRQARDYRAGHIGGLALTGGEPFFDLPKLTAVSDTGHELGCVVSVVTNGFWAESPPAARATLKAVPGIQRLSISTDTYHQRAIPLANVRHAIVAARELGRAYNIAVCTDREDDPQFRQTLAQLESWGEAERTRVSITFPVGRARVASRNFNYRMVAEPARCACSMAGSPVVFPNGDVIGCIGPVFTLPVGHPLHLGNLHREPLREILDRAELNPVLHALRVWGPHRLVALLRESGHAALLPLQYIDDCVCDACYKLLAAPRVVAQLNQLLGTDEMRRMIAYARIYYLEEPEMAELLGIGTEPEEVVN